MAYDDELAAWERELAAYQGKRKAIAMKKYAKIELPREIPKEFICPISHLIMHDPVTIEGTDGRLIYDRRSIEKWFKTCNEEKKPLTYPFSRERVKQGAKLIAQKQLKSEIHNLRKSIKRKAWYFKNLENEQSTEDGINQVEALKAEFNDSDEAAKFLNRMKEFLHEMTTSIKEQTGKLCGRLNNGDSTSEDFHKEFDLLKADVMQDGSQKMDAALEDVRELTVRQMANQHQNEANGTNGTKGKGILKTLREFVSWIFDVISSCITRVGKWIAAAWEKISNFFSFLYDCVDEWIIQPIANLFG